MPKDRKMDQVSIKYTNHLPLQDPPKFIQIWIFGFFTPYGQTVVGTSQQRFAHKE
jgi:hypothetical protein